MTLKDDTLIVDLREKGPIDVINKDFRKKEFRRLVAGDYACGSGCCGFERKESDFSDYAKVLTQVEELKQEYQNAYLVVNISLDHWIRSGNRPVKIGFIASLMARGITPLFVEGYMEMLDILHTVIKKNHDGKYRGPGEFSTVRRIKSRDQQIHILLSLPGVGLDKAEKILEEFGSVGNFLTAEPEAILSLNGIGKKTADKIFDVIWKED